MPEPITFKFLISANHSSPNISTKQTLRLMSQSNNHSRANHICNNHNKTLIPTLNSCSHNSIPYFFYKHAALNLELTSQLFFLGEIEILDIVFVIWQRRAMWPSLWPELLARYFLWRSRSSLTSGWERLEEGEIRLHGHGGLLPLGVVAYVVR